MTKELCHVIEQMSREKGISKETLIEALESALLSAMRKKYGGRTNIHLKIDRAKCDITTFETKRIVAEVVDPLEEISLADAAKIDPDKKEGDTIDFPLDLQDLGRIAAQTAKQVIFQRVREAERDVIYNDFKDKIGQIISGVVMRKEKGAYFLNLGKTEAVLHFKDTLPNENLKRGDTVKAIIEDVKITTKGPSIVVSRSSPQLVGELFRMEVPEIHEGLVIIKDIVREPGERTKIAVFSKNHSVDPVGSCVGMKGTRVQTIVRELRGERIDIIPWNDDPRVLIASALSPASVEKIGINEEDKTAMVVVNDQMLSLAIGKRGQNVRLAMKLTGWDIDIISDTEYSKIRMEETDKALEDSLKKEARKKIRHLLMDKDPHEHSIKDIKGIGPERAKLFSRLGILTIQDALYYLPCRYEDRRALKKISELSPGGIETVQGKIVFSNSIRTRMRKFQIFEISVNDGTGFIKAKWFNQPYLQKGLPSGREVVLSGFVKNTGQAGFEMESPEYELVSDDKDSFIHTRRLVPVYNLTAGISQKQFRKTMFLIVNEHALKLQDPLPPPIISRNNLPGLAGSVRQLHFPEADPALDMNIDSLNSGTSIYHRRLIFDELFLLELGLAALKKRTRHNKGISFSPEGDLRKALLKVLPFALTDAQKRALADIRKDMRSPWPMNRLVQGDVGCGKTIVALMAMLDAVEAGYQAALMAPTEILAGQHYINIHGLLQGLGLKTELLTGGPKARQLEGIASGETRIIIGTHALIQEGVKFKKLGLAVVDEQHKFGVMQRSLLRKKGAGPDLLVMTATPIPRSLALTLYGDLDCSVIDELPPGRRPVETKIFDADRKKEIYGLLREEIEKGRQAYVVYPAIEESEKTDLKNAVQGKEGFQRIFPEYRIGLLHGRMATEEREDVMRSFKQGEVDVLVSTTVIEVGVDVPSATLMLIVHAERFGLSQLHQLRGRVGRGADRSICVLVAYKPYAEEAARRLDIMLSSSDGFRIAEEDLAIRGPGEFLGTRQAGMPDLKVANIIRDMKILEKAKAEAFSLIEKGPELGEFPSLKKAVEVFWKGKKDLFRAG